MDALNRSSIGAKGTAKFKRTIKRKTGKDLKKLEKFLEAWPM